MPAKSKAQQKFMGMVHAAQKGETPASAAVAKAASQMDKEDAEDYASTKHKGLPKKMKKETKVRSLIRKMVREIMAEDFAGAHPEHKRKKFDNMRRKQSEVLGYTLTGKDDIKVEIDDATIKEELYNSQGEGYTFGKGDIVKDINPDCPHHGAEGEVIKGGKVKEPAAKVVREAKERNYKKNTRNMVHLPNQRNTEQN